MYAIKRTGHGNTICAGCLAKGKQAIHWDNMLLEVRYDSGEVIGDYCSECIAKIRENNTVEVRKNETKKVSV
jgi:hypothetical protein